MRVLVEALATWLISAWLVAGLVLAFTKLLGRDAPQLARDVFHELRPFVLTAVLVQFGARALEEDGLGTWDWINLGLNLWNWFSLRNTDDDDRWKRRRKRLAERVAVLDGRLAVVPGGAG